MPILSTQRLPLLLLAYALARVPDATSQGAAPLQPGQRIRVALSSGGSPLIGRIQRITPDSLVMLLESGATRVAVPFPGVLRIDRSLAGPKRQTLRGALIGGGLGLAVGVVDLLANPGFSDSRKGEILLRVGGSGVAIGVLAGLATKRDSWSPVPESSWRSP